MQTRHCRPAKLHPLALILVKVWIIGIVEDTLSVDAFAHGKVGEEVLATEAGGELGVGFNRLEAVASDDGCACVNARGEGLAGCVGVGEAGDAVFGLGPGASAKAVFVGKRGGEGEAEVDW